MAQEALDKFSKYVIKHNARRDRKVDSRRADEFIKYCTVCRKCWEIPRHWKRPLSVYDNFPSYGKEKKVCPLCSN